MAAAVFAAGPDGQRRWERVVPGPKVIQVAAVPRIDVNDQQPVGDTSADVRGGKSRPPFGDLAGIGGRVQYPSTTCYRGDFPVEREDRPARGG